MRAGRCVGRAQGCCGGGTASCGSVRAGACHCTSAQTREHTALSVGSGWQRCQPGVTRQSRHPVWWGRLGLRGRSVHLPLHFAVTRNGADQKPVFKKARQVHSVRGAWAPTGPCSSHNPSNDVKGCDLQTGGASRRGFWGPLLSGWQARLDVPSIQDWARWGRRGQQWLQ